MKGIKRQESAVIVPLERLKFSQFLCVHHSQGTTEGWYVHGSDVTDDITILGPFKAESDHRDDMSDKMMVRGVRFGP